MKLKLVGGDSEGDKNEEEFKYPEHNMVIKGIKLYLRIEPVPCGFDVEYYTVMKHETPFGTIETRPVAVGEHIHPKWWWKLILRTPEKQIKKAIKDMKFEINAVQIGESVLDKMSL